MNYCLPSLLAPGNIPALARKRKVVHSIVTTEADRDRIVAHPAFARLQRTRRSGLHVLPAGVLGEARAEWIQFLSLLRPARPSKCLHGSALKADLYLLPIDCVYLRDCLKHFSAYLKEMRIAARSGP